jgi:8-oxo-dGTP pyrophosphatase MutT (NUDIX family)
MKTASLVYIVQNGKTLLGEKKKGEIGTGTLNGAGGKLEEGETILQCAVRETREEFGLTIQPEDLRQVARVTFYAAGQPDFEVHVYRADTFSGDVSETDEMYKPEWYSLDALPFERMLESDRAWMGRALTGEPFTANVRYRERAQGYEGIEFLAPDF